MKVLFVGDVHNHQYMFDDVMKLDNKYKFDRIIFTGDYVDDWFTDNHDSLKTLETVLTLKNSNPNKYTFCIGNHEMSYLGHPCSGHRFELDYLVQQKLVENIDCFDFYASVELNDKEYVCSHAGFTNDYVRHILKGKDKWKENIDIMNSKKLASLNLLNLVSEYRGGMSDFSSFVWTDRVEHNQLNLVEEPILKYQIIGHSPVMKINLDKDFIFIDTHSTYRDGSKYGDQSYLIWDEYKFITIKREEII